MNFAELNAAVVALRHSLHSFVGKGALNEVTILPPAGDSDEASFLRLVNWSYVLLFEAGRVTVPYLLKLPSGDPSTHSKLRLARQLVHSLRTWSAHDIGFYSERNAAIMREVNTWFIELCSRYPPNSCCAWRESFLGLCSEVGAIVEHCQGAVALAVSTPDDKEDTIGDLRRRIDRSWTPEKFDTLVGDACTRFSLNLDLPKFRNPRLSRWREFLETVPESDDPERRVIAIIERDILDHTNDILPINGEDVMGALNLDPGPKVGNALRRARELFRSGIRDPEQLLECLRNDERFTLETQP